MPAAEQSRRKGPRSEHGGRAGRAAEERGSAWVPCPEPRRGPGAGGTQPARARTGRSRAGRQRHQRQRGGAAPPCGERGREGGAGPARTCATCGAAAAAGPGLHPRRGGAAPGLGARPRPTSRSVAVAEPPARLAAESACAAREDGGTGPRGAPAAKRNRFTTGAPRGAPNGTATTP